MKAILKYLWDNFETIFMQLFFWLLLLTVCVNITLRFIFNYPLFFAEELCRTFFIWMCFFGFGYVTHVRGHIRIDVFISKLPRIPQLIRITLLNIIALAVFGWIFINACKYIDYSAVRVSLALEVPVQYYYIILPISSAIMIIRTIEIIIKDFKAFSSTNKRAQASTETKEVVAE